MKLKRLFVRYKIYYDRARAYIGAVQFLMLSIILAKQFGIELGYGGSVLLVVVFLAGCLAVGYADTKLGIRQEEASNYNAQNPEITEILNTVKRIENDSCNSCKG